MERLVLLCAHVRQRWIVVSRNRRTDGHWQRVPSSIYLHSESTHTRRFHGHHLFQFPARRLERRPTGGVSRSAATSVATSNMASTTSSTHCHFTPPRGVSSIVISMSLCLSVCASLCPLAYLRNHTAKRHLIFVHVACGRGLLVLRRRCDTLCTSGSSGFVDYVMFSLSMSAVVRHVCS